MSNVIIDREKIDILANAISDKSGVPVTMTFDEMVEAVDGIEQTIPSGNINIVRSGITDVTNYATVTVPSADVAPYFSGNFFTQNNVRKWRANYGADVIDAGWLDENVLNSSDFNAVPSNTSVTPSSSAQTIGGANYIMEGAVTVAAMPSGTAGTPTATKGTVSNHSISVTPSVTNTSGYITGSTKTGTAVTVTASELASGNKAITENGTNIDVVGYSTVSVSIPFVTYYTGSSTPASSLGSNGDIYLKVVS